MTGETNLTLTGHFGELRRSLLLGAVPFLAAAAAGTALSDLLLAWVFAPARLLSLPLHLFRLGDGMVLRIRAGVLAAAAVTAPWSAFCLYRFVRPGLARGEARLVLRVSLTAGITFTAGAAGMFLWAAPALLRLWAGSRGAHTLLGAGAYFSMWETACLWAGIFAALPALIPVLVNILRKRRDRP